MAVKKTPIALESLYAVPLMMIFLFLQIFLIPTTICALSGSHGSPSSVNTGSKPSPSDRILTPEYYRSVYKGLKIDQWKEQPVQNGGNTPWDIGNHRPQPAIVRAYEEGKLRGHVLDAGCGVGENCVYLAHKFGISSVTGFDLSEDAVKIASDLVALEDERETTAATPFWTKPRFLAASCTEVADKHGSELLEGLTGEEDDKIGGPKLFDVVIDSGLLHCLSEEAASSYVQQISKLLKPTTGRFYIGCFSTENPDPWDNPRRISEEYLRNDLFSCRETWEVISCKECWWARPPSRGSSTGGGFSLALWVEVSCIKND